MAAVVEARRTRQRMREERNTGTSTALALRDIRQVINEFIEEHWHDSGQGWRTSSGPFRDRHDGPTVVPRCAKAHP